MVRDIDVFVDLTWWVVIAIILAALVLRFKRLDLFKRLKKKSEIVPRSFEYFDELTGGGISKPSMVMVTGDPESERVLLCEELIYRDLQNGKPWIYVTYRDLPSNVRNRLQKFGHQTELFENQGLFMIIDCYSPLAGAPITENEKRVIAEPHDLTKLSIEIMEAVRSLPEHSVRVFLDSTSLLFNKLEPGMVVTFLHEMGAKIKGYYGVFYFTVVPEGVQKAALKRLEEMSDCIIETKVKEAGRVCKRWLRVRKMTGRKFEDKRVQFEINPGGSFTFYVKSETPKVFY